MNKLKSDYYYGIGLEWDDLRFSDSAVREAFEGILSGLRTPNRTSFILTGCVITPDVGGDYVTAGFINIDGEICKVDTHLLPVPNPGDELYWKIEVTFDPAGSELFENGSSGDTYEVRKGVITAGLLPVGAVRVGDMKNVQYSLLETLGSYEDLWKLLYPWRDVKAFGTSSNPLDWSYTANTGGNVRFRILPWGEVQVQGSLITTGVIGFLNNLITFNTAFPSMFGRRFYVTSESSGGALSTIGLSNIPATGLTSLNVMAIDQELFLDFSMFLT